MHNKRLLAHLLFLIAFPVFSHSQALPKSHSSWEGMTYGLEGPTGYRNVLCGDTTINNLEYTKFWSLQGEQLVYRAAVRTAGPRSYFVKPGESVERLLYDYTLQQGQSITLQLAELEGEVDLKVASVAVIGQGDSTRKVINFVPVLGIQETWVEGVGSLFGPLKRGFIALDAYSELHCQKIGEEVVYRTGASDGCPFTYNCQLTSVASPPLAEEVQVFPTVSGGRFQLLNTSNSRLSACLIDQMGRRLETIGPLGAGQYTLDFGAYPAGIYYLQLVQWDKKLYLQHFKLMITK